MAHRKLHIDSPLKHYRYLRGVQKLSPQAACVSVIMDWAETATEARDRINHVRAAYPARRQFELGA